MSPLSVALTRTLGVMVPPNLPAGAYREYVTEAERLGFDEVWLAEDCFLKGGIAQAAIALEASRSIVVGIGILPASARNVAFTALEVAFLANMHPGRVVVGIGHGMPQWMRSVGAHRASPLGFLSEYLDAIRALLSGDLVTTSGRYVHLSQVRLEEAPGIPPPVLAGVRGPKSLDLAGRHADGTILAEPVTPEYLDRARAQIAATGPHRVVAYNAAAVDGDPDVARAQVRDGLRFIGDSGWSSHIDPLPFAVELNDLRRRSRSREEFAEALPSAWVNQLAVVGTVRDATMRIDALYRAGADSVVLSPSGPDPLDALQALGGIRLADVQ